MPLTDSYVDLAKDVQTRLEAAAVSLGLTAVYYGDQDRIPTTPAACVEPGDKDRELNGMPRRTEVEMTVYVILYLYNLKSPEEIREDVDTIGEAVESLLHTDAQLRGVGGEPTVIDSMVRRVESGYQQKRNSLFRATRLTFVARSQVQLPMYTP
jgi:hypothetical protein